MKGGNRGKSYNPSRYTSSFNAIKGNTLFTVTNSIQNNGGFDFYNNAPNTRLVNEVNKHLELTQASEADKDTMKKLVSLK